MTDGSFSQGGRFRGLNLSTPAYNLAPGELQEALNVVLEERDVLVRPGAQGKFSSTLAGELFALTPYESGLLFASGGKLYRWAVGATSPTEILQGGGSLSPALASSGVQVSTILSAAFVVDGSGALRRTDGSTATTLTELNRPAAPVATIYHETLSSLGALTWSQNAITGSLTEPAASGAGDTLAPMSSIRRDDGDFWDASNLSGRPFWNTRAGAPAYSANVQDGNARNAVELDSDTGVGDSVQSDPIVLNPGTDAGTYARVGVLQYEAAGEDATTNSMQVEADVVAYSDTGGITAISGSTKTWRSPFLQNDKSTQVRQLIDLRGLNTVPRSIKIGFTQPINTNTAQGADVNGVALFVPAMAFGVSAGSDGRLSVRQGSVQVWQGFGMTASLSGAVGGTSDPASSGPGRLLTAGLTLTAALGSTQNWSGVRTVGLELLPASGVVGLALRLGFKVGSTWYYTEPLDIPTAAAPETSVWAVGELRDVAANLTAVTHVAVEVLSDVSVEGLQEGGDQLLFRLGELRNVGNLPEGRPVWYKLVEMDQASDGTNLLDVIWSDGSPSTPLLEATRGSRMGRLKLTARTNPGAEWFALYRFGGALLPVDSTETVQGRLIGLIQYGASDFAFGGDADKGTAPRIVAFANPYLSWDKVDTGSVVGADSILIDNTPDSWLEGADIYLTGREKAPSAPAAITAWDNRLWVAQGADLYASWRLSAGATAGVYWSRLQLPESSDPEAGIKGHWERLALPPGDSIQRLVALPDHLIVLTSHTVFVGTKTDGIPLYAFRRIRGADVAGPTNHRAVCEDDGAALWLAHDGLRACAGGEVVRVHPELRIPIQEASEAQRAAAALSSTPTRTFLRLGDYLWVWHSREQGWTRWNLTAKLAAVLGESLYVAGSVGQIFEMTGTGDKALSASSAVDITARIHTRQENGGAMLLTPTWAHLDVVAGEAVDVQIVVHGGVSAANPTYTQSIPSGPSAWRKKISRAGEGRGVSLEVEVETGAAFRWRGLAVSTIERRRIND